MVPDALVGVWRRVGLLLDGARVVDYSDVLWLQTPQWYADIRLPIEPGRSLATPDIPEFFHAEIAFAGAAMWERGVITWQHQFDNRPNPEPDSAPPIWDGRLVSEHGESVVSWRKVSYVEQWMRITDDEPSWSVTHDESGLRVQVDSLAIDIHDERPGGAFSAVRYEQRAGEWCQSGRITAA